MADALEGCHVVEARSSVFTRCRRALVDVHLALFTFEAVLTLAAEASEVIRALALVPARVTPAFINVDFAMIAFNKRTFNKNDNSVQMSVVINFFLKLSEKCHTSYLFYI